MAAVVEDVYGAFTADGTSVNANLSPLPDVGNHVIATVSCWRPGATLSAASDNQGNSYAVDKTTGAGGGFCGIASGKIATSAGTFTLTVTSTSSGSYFAWSAAHVSGLDATTWKHKDGTASGSSAAGAVSASSANTTADCIAVACICLTTGDSNVALTTPSGYTQIAVYNDVNSYCGHQASYKIESGTQTSSATWGHDNNSWVANIVTYAPAAGGGGGRTTKNTRSHPLGIGSGINWRVTV